ncbi:keratin, type II cytoskeletal 1-like [Panicum virgatum]|uniref:keratin, type II cytoskeletal 1-like n=1 Tax=Panicum virgatum TaxID=38727 RepID=UPI0019D5B4DE|nr:keratin, type II cytoskeletal 1-like [Panicum virgatum]
MPDLGGGGGCRSTRACTRAGHNLGSCCNPGLGPSRACAHARASLGGQCGGRAAPGGYGAAPGSGSMLRRWSRGGEDGGCSSSGSGGGGLGGGGSGGPQAPAGGGGPALLGIEQGQGGGEPGWCGYRYGRTATGTVCGSR